MDAAALIRDFESERPLAVRLAEAVSLAVLIDPPLLRRARRELVPEADPGTEADFWSSPLVQTRSVDGLVLIPEVAQELRRRLRDSGRLDPAWELTRNLHAHLSPALQMEEKIAWLSVSPGSAEEIEKLLRSVLAALVVGEKTGLAHWAARALPRLPSGVRDLDAARLLEAGSSLRLGGDARSLDEEIVDDLSWITPADLPRVPVRVRLLDGAVELDAGATDGNVLQVPETDPLLINLSWEETGGERSKQVTLRRGEKDSVPVTGDGVRLRTILGEVYELRMEGRVGGRLRDWIIDFSEERARHRPFFGREKEQEEILSLIDQAGDKGRLILFQGKTGEGKTALLAHMIDLFTKEGRLPLQHFFRRWAESADAATAERSLRAQLVERSPELENFAMHLRLPALLERLGQEGLLARDGQPLVLVLDAIDEAWSERAGEGPLELLPENLPPGFAVLASARPGAFEELQLPETGAVLSLEKPTRALFESWFDALLESRRQSGTPPGMEVSTEGNFGIARVLQRWNQGPWWMRNGNLPESYDLQGLWQEALASLGSLAEPWLGTLAAARGPLPSSVFHEVLGIEGFNQTRSSPFETFRETTGEPVHELAEEVLRDFIASRLDLAPHHRRIVEIVTAAFEEGHTSDEMFDYALRHAVGHWLAAGDPREAIRLALSAKFLTEKCRTLGLAALRRDLIDCLSLGREEERASIQDLLEVSREDADFLQREPEALVSFVYTRLLLFWKPEDIRDLLQLEAGQPPLRPKPPVEDLKPRSAQRHRSAIVGCRFLDRPGTVPAVLSWTLDGTLRLWEPSSGEVVTTFVGHNAKVTGAALLGPGRLVTSSSGGTLRLWGLGEDRFSKILGGHEGEVLGVLGLSDRRAVSWSVDRTIRIWDVEEGREELILRGHEDTVTSCALTRDGWTLFSGSADTTVRQWDLSSGELMHTWRGHQGPVTALEAGEGFVVSASLDGTLRVWPLWASPSFEPMTLTGHSLGFLGCVLHLERLATWSYDQTIIVWDSNLGPFSSWQGPEKKVILRGHTAAVLSCTFFPNGDRLVSASADGTLRIWDVETGETLHVLTGHSGPVRAVAMDTEYISGLRGRIAEQIVSASDDRTLRVWNAESGEEMAVLDGDNETLHCIALQDRRRIVTWSRMGDLKIYHVDGHEPPGWLGSPGMSVGGALVTADDRKLILWSRSLVQGQVRIAVWDLERGQEVASFRGPESPFVASAVTPDGSRLVVGSMVGGVGVWDLVKQQSVTWIPGHSGPITAIQMSQDGEWALTASWDGTLRILDLRKMTSLEMGIDHKDRVLACAMNWDARAAVSASADRTLYLWRLEEGQGRRLTGHEDQVTGCAFTRDGTRVVSCSLDGTLAIWDALSGAILHRLRGHADWINAFVIDDERGVLYSCSEDRTVRAWDLVSGEARGVVYGVSPFRSLALTYDGVAAGDESGSFWALELVGPGKEQGQETDFDEGYVGHRGRF